ncbi:MAG: ATP-dependent DNA helicase, partial [Phycisphaerae bacterium]
MLTISDVLGPEGLVAKRLDSYEFRPEQLEMATAVESAFDRRNHLLIEAGTGVGKTFAYLLPAIQAVAEQGKRVVISTHTIALQEQLIEKDIPFLDAVLPFEFSAVLVKGRSNYLGLRRLASTSKRQESLFSNRQREELHRIEDWAYETRDGSLSDLSPLPEPVVWDKVRSEHGNCMGRRCPTYGQCFYQRARRRAENAQLLIVNHALFLSDLALRRQGSHLLPQYDYAILDEAHTLDRVGLDHFGGSVSDGQIYFLLNGLLSEKWKIGFLATCHAQVVAQAVEDARRETRMFFEGLKH